MPLALRQALHVRPQFWVAAHVQWRGGLWREQILQRALLAQLEDDAHVDVLERPAAADDLHDVRVAQRELQLELGAEGAQVGLVELVAVQLLDGDRRAVERGQPHLAKRAAAELGGTELELRRFQQAGSSAWDAREPRPSSAPPDRDSAPSLKRRVPYGKSAPPKVTHFLHHAYHHTQNSILSGTTVLDFRFRSPSPNADFFF